MKKWYLLFIVISIALLLGFGVFRWQSLSTATDTTLRDKKQIIVSISPGDGVTMIDKNRKELIQ